MPKFIRRSLLLGAAALVYDLISMVYSRINHTTSTIHWWRALGVAIIAVPIFWLINKGKESTAAHSGVSGV